MDSFILSFNVIFPMTLLIALGYILLLKNILDESTALKLNRMIFVIFTPTTLFLNIYKTDISQVWDLRLLGFAVTSVLVIYFTSFIFYRHFVKDRRRKSVLIQAAYRTNIIFFGLPITLAIFGDSNAGQISLLIAIIVPLYNFLAVVLFEVFNGKKANISRSFVSILKNPLIIASMLGFIINLSDIKIPISIYNGLNDISKITTPLALIVLGASLKISALKNDAILIAFASTLKLIIIPSILLGIAAYIGFRGVELVALLSVFASPVAVASYNMAHSMGGDSDLAASLVVTTSVFSVFTLFFFIGLLNHFGLIF